MEHPSIAQPSAGQPALTPYQATLPYVRGHDPDGQWELFDAGNAIAELGPDPELGELDVGTLDLFASEGVFKHATRWRRHNAGGPKKHVGWRQLDLALRWRDDHRGAKWSQNELDALEHVRAQTWNRRDAERRRFRETWLAGAFVSPLDGRVVPVPTNPVSRHLLDLVIDAAGSGTGGLYMSREDLAAVLGCAPRGVWNHRKRLGNLIRGQIVWQPATDNNGKLVGSRNGWVLLRIGPDIEALAALNRLARSRSNRGGSTQRKAARLVAATLLARGARRRYDVAGAYWRGERGIALNARKLRSSIRQNLPSSSPLKGLRDGPAPLREAPGARPLDPIECARSARDALAGRRPSIPTEDSRPSKPATPDPARDAAGLGARASPGGDRGPPRIADVPASSGSSAFEQAYLGGDLLAALAAATAAFR